MNAEKRPHPMEVIMAERGLSHEGLAKLHREAVAAHGLRSAANRNLLWKWKVGRQTPTAESQQYLAEALGVPLDVLVEQAWPDWLWHAVTGTKHLLQPPWSVAGTRQVLREVAGGTVDRRKFMVVTGTALTGLGASWAAGLAGGSVEQVAAGRGAGWLTTQALDRVDATLAGLRHLDDEFGGGELCQMAVGQFRWLTDLADKSVCTGATERRLFGLITEAARLCGWCHFDATLHAAAQSFWVAGLRASASAQDRWAGANVLSCMSIQATMTGHPQEAVSLIDSAQEQLRGSGSPRLKAMLASRQALAYAKSGEAAACGRALAEAESQLDRARPGDDEPDWIYYFDESTLAGWAGTCWIDLRQPARARHLIDDALTIIEADYVRDRSIIHARSARAYVHDDELDQACRELTTAADLARQTGSAMAIDSIRQTREDMVRYDREPRVRELDHHLAVLVT
ncbi:MAG: hypothetical protein ACR2GH_02975 [Pseudonocardia sp.]